jgi:hypothetical protein
MFLGLVKEAADTSTEFSRYEVSAPIHNINASGNDGPLDLLRRSRAFATFVPGLLAQLLDGSIDKSLMNAVGRSAWQETVEAANQAYVPGTFTTFAAFEYTSSTNERGNLHRNVIFRDSERLPAVPFSRFNSQNPEGLWDWMDTLREQGVESLAIPHNSNGSNGAMFMLTDWAGNEIDLDYANQRLRNEPLVEITQVKGSSETHPLLSKNDEWADFEITPYRVATKLHSEPAGGHVRDALQRAQVIKGWLENGEHREQVYDVSCSDGLSVDSQSHRCPDNGARVDLNDCAYSTDAGAAELKTLWRDPDFTPGQEAFYYVRVLENPVCRWSTWDAIMDGEKPRSDLPSTIQERAWSSPIWYTPTS